MLYVAELGAFVGSIIAMQLALIGEGDTSQVLVDIPY